jgi:hypothetical protein
VLLGAVLTYVHQHLGQFVQARQQRQLSMRATENLCCHVMLEIARRFHLGLPTATTEELIQLTQVGAGPIEEALLRLERGGFLVYSVKKDNKESNGYVPGRDLQTIRLRDVLHFVRTEGEPLEPPLFHSIHPVLRPLLERSESLRYQEIHETTLSALLNDELAEPV